MIDRILIADDEFLVRQLLEETARRRGIEVVAVSSGEEAIECLGKDEFQMAFLDLKMGKASGIDVLRHAMSKHSQSLFVIMTAYGTVDTAIEAIKLGAFDFVIKPFSPDQMDVLIEKARLWLQMDQTNKYLRKELAAQPDIPEPSGDSRIVGSSRCIKSIMYLIERVGAADTTVLITGESGTGKELVASEINAKFDPSGAKPYIRMNCAAVPEALLESELFGHERGAFTGATERRIGRFELADGGTLLLDEIGEINPNMQAKLLRVLQESEFERVGGSKTIKVNVRLLATTNRDLKREVSEGRFREDLYYRLNVFPVHLPPLREREEDCMQIARIFLQAQSRKLGRPLKFSPDAIASILRYPWPGNVRELQHVIERVAILEDGPEIAASALPSDIIQSERAQKSGALKDRKHSEMEDDEFNLSIIEREVIMKALEKTSGNKTKAAQLLGFSIRTLRNKLNEYNASGEHGSEQTSP